MSLRNTYEVYEGDQYSCGAIIFFHTIFQAISTWQKKAISRLLKPTEHILIRASVITITFIVANL